MNNQNHSHRVTFIAASLFFAATSISVAATDPPDRLGISLGAYRIDSIDVTAAED